MNEQVSIKAITDSAVTVAGYGVIWGAHDLEGDTFTRDTDLDLDYVPVKRVYYDHKLDPDAKEVLGKVTATLVDETGLWVEAQLDRSAKYVAAVVKLIEKGVLGWSSGSISHLVHRGGSILKSWPIAEFSLTPTPAEPRTLGVRRLKALVAEHPELEALLDEVAIAAALADAERGDEAPVGTKTIAGDTIMPENVTPDTTPAIDFAAFARQAADEAVKAYRAELAKEEPAVKGAARVAAEVRDPNDHGPYKSFGQQLQAIMHACTPGNATPEPLKAFKATGLNEGVSSEGGFLVQSDLAAGILTPMHEQGQILSRVNRIPISGNANGLKLNAVDQTSRADGSRWGGVNVYWAAEAATATKSKPALRQMNLDLKKMLAFYYATDEVLADASALEALTTQAFREEMTFKAEDAVIRGTGAGQPLGILTTGMYVSVTKETGQAADTFVFNNALKMWSRCWAPSRRNAVWFINQDVEPQLYGMSMSVGTGGVPVYMPAGGISGAPYATLFGRPVIPVEQADTVGDLGDVLLLDLSQYLLIEKGGLQAASSIHVMFLYDESTFRFTWRLDGQPAWNSVLTPANSSNTLSPFVALAARA
jgi:HK97 family phage major capsid protein